MTIPNIEQSSKLHMYNGKELDKLARQTTNAMEAEIQALKQENQLLADRVQQLKQKLGLDVIERFVECIFETCMDFSC